MEELEIVAMEELYLAPDSECVILVGEEEVKVLLGGNLEEVAKNYKQLMAEKKEAEKLITRYLKSGLSFDVVREKMLSWYPGMEVGRIVNPEKKLVKLIAEMTEEEREMLKKMMMKDADGMDGMRTGEEIGPILDV